MKKPSPRFIRDSLINIVGLTGLTLIAVGLWNIHPPTAKIVMGAVLLSLSLYAVRLKRPKGR